MADRTIRAIIKLLVEGGHVPKEVAESIKGVGDKAKRTKSELGALGQAGKDLNGLLRQYLGAAAVGSFIRGSVSEFASLDRAWNSLGFTMNKVGVDAKTALPRARAEMEALAASGGPLQSQTVPALQKFITMTKDTDKALAAVKLASDVSESGITDFGSAAAGVAALLQGRVKVAATQFGIDLTDINGKAKTNAQLIEEIRKTYGGLGDAFDDAANDLDKQAASWERLKQIVGAGLAPALRLLPEILNHTIGLLKDLGEVAGLVFNGIIALARGTGRGLAAAFDFKTLLTDPGKYVERLKETQAKNLAEMGDAWSTFTEGLAANHAKAADKVADTSKGMAGLIKQATKAAADDEVKAAKESAEKRFDAEIAIERKGLQERLQVTREGSIERRQLESQLIDVEEKDAVERARRTGSSIESVRQTFREIRIANERQAAESEKEFQERAIDDLLQLEIERAEEGSDQRFLLEQQAINRRYTAELAAANLTGRDTTRIRLAWERELGNKTLQFIAAKAQRELEETGRVVESEREMRDEQFTYALLGLEETSAKAYEIQKAAIEAHFQDVEDDLNAQLEANARSASGTLAIQTALMNKLVTNETRRAIATKTLDLAVTQSKKQQALEAAQTAVAALAMVFGKHKAFALASIAIDTAIAVMKVWAGSGEWYEKLAKTLMIAAIAEGQRQVVMGASAGGGGGAASASAAVGPSSGSAASAPSTSGSGSIAAATGTIVPEPSGRQSHDDGPRGKDTVAIWAQPGEIIAPEDASSEVLAGRAVIAAGSMKGSPDAPAKPIVGGRLSLIPTIGRAVRGLFARSRPTDAVGTASMAAAPGTPTRAARPKVAHAASGMVVPGQPARMRAELGSIAPGLQEKPRPTLDDDSVDLGRQKGNTHILGGKKFSTELFASIGAGIRGRGLEGGRGDGPNSRRVEELLGEIKAELAKPPADPAEPRVVDQSFHVHGNVLGGDTGARELSRIVKRGERLDSNRLVK